MKLGDKVMNKLTGRQMETIDVDLNQMVNLLCRLFIAQTTTNQEADQVYTTVKGGLIREKKLLSKDERFEITCYTGRKTGPFNLNDHNVIWINDTKYDKYYEYRSFSFKKLKTIIKCNVQQKKTSGASGMESGCMNIPYPEAEINLQQFQGEKYKDRNWVPILWGGSIAFVVLILAVAFLTSRDCQEDSAVAETESQIEEIDSDGEEEELVSAVAESGENSADEVMTVYKAECQNFDYREYFRYEQEHLGEKIKLEMQVDQVIDGDFKGYDAQGNEYYIFDEREEESPFRVMEGDVLTVYGEYSGVVELTRALGDYESEVFSITARYADLMGEESETEGADYSGLSSYIGTWEDQYSQRCNMKITLLSESEVSVLIRWSSSGTEESQWAMTGIYQPNSGTLEYADGVLTNNVYQNNGEISSEEAYSGGTGRFYIEDGYLYWVDDVKNQGAECYFQRMGEVSTEPETMAEQIEADNPYQDSILLWKSYYVALTDADCMGVSKEELRIARNEIYAAYGRMFTSQDLIDYFNSKPWYQGTIPSDQFDDSVLTETQKANIRTIQSYEELADEGSDYSARGLAINDEYAIPQIPGEYTYVNNSDDSQYVTLTVGSDVSLAFWGATGYSQEISGFSNMNDQEYSNDEAGVSLIFNNYGQEMVYIMSDGTQITYTFSD